MVKTVVLSMVKICPLLQVKESKNLNVMCVLIFRMKEQLIRELVKTGKDAEQMNKQYADKVTALEKVSWKKEARKGELRAFKIAVTSEINKENLIRACILIFRMKVKLENVS